MDLHLFQADVARLFNTGEDTITGWKNGRSVSQTHFYPQIMDFRGDILFEVSEDTIGGRIKVFRLTHGLSQKRMGKLLSVDGTTVCSWETGQTTPYKRMIEKIVKMLENEAT